MVGRTGRGATFAISFATTWVLVWATANGPLRIVLVRWRFRGGRLLVTPSGTDDLVVEAPEQATAPTHPVPPLGPLVAVRPLG